ncbi:MAG TPA: hypothetical protein VGE67_18435 [Haloferula sp.]
MRKALIAIFAILLVGVGTWGVVKSQRIYSYPYPKVVQEVAHIASSSGANIIDERRVSASLRRAKNNPLNSLIRKISGRPSQDDLDEYTLQDGSDIVRVSIYHSLGKVGWVEIHPTGSSSKPASALASGLATSFPKLDCHLEQP